MISLAPVATIVLSFLLIGLVSAQAPKFSVAADAESEPSTPPADQALQGRVFNADGQPAGGVRVELGDNAQATPRASTYTAADGSFELYNIPPGSYRIVAGLDDSAVSHQVSVQAGRPRVELRLPATHEYGSGATVSVVQMLVPTRAQKKYEKARRAFAQGDADQARSLVDEALITDPQYADALTLRGFIEMQNHDLEAAERYLDQAVHVDPYSGSSYIALGVVYNHEGRYDDALRASQRGVSLSPRAWQGYFEMAKASVGKGMYEKALQFARQAERLGGGGFASLHLMKAYAMVPLKLYSDAKHELQACLSRDPKGKNAEQAQSLLAQLTGDENAVMAAAH